MELVYLWVEKNDVIKGTDFNFGSKYIFSFEKDDKEDKGILSVKDNPNFIENFYSHNINISAIVGKNGIGKSQLLRLIWNGGIENKEYFAIFKSRNSLKLIGIKNKKIDISTKKSPIDLEWNEESIDNLTNLFYTNESVCLDSFNKKSSSKNDSEIIFVAKKYEFLSIESYKKNIIDENSSYLEDINSEVEAQKDILEAYPGEMEDMLSKEEEFTLDEIDNGSLEMIEDIINKSYTYENIQDILHSEIYLKILNIIYDEDIDWYEDMSIPSKLSIVINEKRWDNSIYKRRFFGYTSKMKVSELALSEKILIYSINSIRNYIRFSSLVKKEDFLNILEDYIVNYPNKSPKKNILKNKTMLFQEIKKLNSSMSNLVNSFELVEKINDILLKLEDKNKTLLINFDSDNELIIKEFIKLYIDLLKTSPNIKSILNFNLFPRMSSGNLILLQTFAMLYDKLTNIKDDNILLLLDEVEVYLHPNWQKKFLKLLIGFLSSKFKDKKFHVILATHSPFLLSDIPKSNVVFLGDKKIELKQTFGANIHTLLSDSFFMEDGLMGEFAKGKIEEVVKLLKSKRKLSKKNQEFCENIISIIGEPILQRTLEHQLNQKVYPNETELEKLEREQKEIQEKIDNLKSSNHEKN